MSKTARIFGLVFCGILFLFCAFPLKVESYSNSVPGNQTDSNETQALSPARKDLISSKQSGSTDPEMTQEIQNSTYPPVIVPNLLPIFAPSITFGQLMDGSYQQILETSKMQKEQEAKLKIQNMLAKLEESYKESIDNNQLISSQSNIQTTANVDGLRTTNDDSLRSTDDSLPATDVISPTSTVSNLIANINSLINSESINYQQSDKDTSGVAEWTPPRWSDQNLNLGDAEKTWVTIALLGDSMTDTLQSGLPQLDKLLKVAYPDYTFSLLNYGQGGTDIESGLFRLTNTTTYLGREYPSVLSYKPDILVVESFGYNPWSWEKFDLDRQWLTIAKIIDTVKANSPDTKIILASSIAPNTKIFGDGALNWNNNDKWKKATTIKLYLQNMVNFATSQNYPLADAYHPSLDSSQEGMEKYINEGDHLHPSEEGKQLFSQKIVEAIIKNNFIK